MALEPWINCRDVPVSFRFYTEVLGFDVVVAPDPDPTSFDSRHATLRGYGGILHLDSHSREGPFGGRLYVRTDSVDSLLPTFLSNGLNKESSLGDPYLRGGPVSQTWGMREIWLTDPDGNIITFGQEIWLARCWDYFRHQFALESVARLASPNVNGLIASLFVVRGASRVPMLPACRA